MSNYINNKRDEEFWEFIDKIDKEIEEGIREFLEDFSNFEIPDI